MLNILSRKKRGLSGSDLGRQIREARFTVLDTELTGLDSRKDSIVSIGAVRMHGGRIEMGESYYRLLRPDAALTSESVLIHEITPSEVSEKPSIGDVVSEFIAYCGSDMLVGFCIGIDMEFLCRETKRLLGTAMANKTIDIRPIYEWIRQKEALSSGKGLTLASQYRLYDMAGYFEIAVTSSHNALSDAYLTAQIFQRMIPWMGNAGIENVRDLLGLSERLKGGDRLNLSGEMF